MAYSVLASTASNSGNPDTNSATIDATGADLIVVFLGWFVTITPTLTLSDSVGGNSYSALTQQTGDVTGGQFYYVQAPNVSNAMTFTAAGSTTFPGISVIALSGSVASPFGTENGVGQSDASPLQTGSVTPPENDCIVLSGIVHTGTSLAINSSMTIAAQVAINVGNSFGTGIAYIIQTSAGAINPTWTITGGGGRAGVIANFKDGGGGGGGNPWYAYAQQRQKVERTWNRNGLLWHPSYAFAGVN